MVEKYFKQEGHIAFHLWMFALALRELSKVGNKEKAATLRERIIEFSESAWMFSRGTRENRDDIQKMIDDLTVMILD